MENKNLNIQNLLQKLEDKDGFEREEARKELVKIGEDSIPYLLDLSNDPKHILRWESIKALAEMKNESLIPFLLEKLKQDESDVRWIAAEGLCKMGKPVLVPLLKAILEDTDSVFLLSGAHHVIHHLKLHKQHPKNVNLDDLLPLLKITALEEKLKIVVYDILSKLE